MWSRGIVSLARKLCERDGRNPDALASWSPPQERRITFNANLVTGLPNHESIYVDSEGDVPLWAAYLSEAIRQINVAEAARRDFYRMLEEVDAVPDWESRLEKNLSLIGISA